MSRIYDQTCHVHLDFYRKNRSYSEGLRDSDPRKFQSLPQVCASQSFYRKYEAALRDGAGGGASVLDVGCGVGQVVRALAETGVDAHGVEVSETNVALAREQAGAFHLYDGRTLPFADGSFGAVGAFNVLEHVEEPVALLDEMTRVLRPGGCMVISSPNFLRVLGWLDYHPHMRGFPQKWRNAQSIRSHLRHYRENPDAILFEKMAPIQREIFQPDDDAITATNGLDIGQFFRSRKFGKIRVSCVDRPVPGWMGAVLDLTPLRFVMLNSFVTAEKPRS